MTGIIRHLFVGCCIPLFVGCTHYEYDLVHPPELAQHIGTKSDVSITLSPLRYELRAFENHLVMRIYNQADVPVRLLGDRSVVVDPQSQSHPLRSQTIAPGSFIKLILPPLPPAVEPRGPTIGIGIGVGYGYGYGHGRWREGLDDPFWDYGYYEPRYINVYDSGEYLWDWKGDSEVSVTLTLQRGDEKTFSQTFVFRQKSVR